mmetsp:Transcript_25469/g.58253  ORF Transcript_25469/g.58253 Transcript_25469/m.58253 type:complete len:124 (-) Transcript_25469:184-555(-)
MCDAGLSELTLDAKMMSRRVGNSAFLMGAKHELKACHWAPVPHIPPQNGSARMPHSVTSASTTCMSNLSQFFSVANSMVSHVEDLSSFCSACVWRNEIFSLRVTARFHPVYPRCAERGCQDDQ